MSSDKPNVDPTKLVLDFDHKAILVASNVKDNSVAWKNASSPSVRGFDVSACCPGGAFRIVIPRPQRLLCISVFWSLPKLLESPYRNNVHHRLQRVLYYVPKMGASDRSTQY